MTASSQFLTAFDASGINPRFLPAAYGMLAQESAYGNASPNLLQVTAGTAADPGYGLAPLSEADRNDPQKSTAFALHLLKAKADQAGLNFDNPDDYAAILRLHNGGGDPSYVQHVAARIPSSAPEADQEKPLEGQQMAAPQAPQLSYTAPPIPDALQEASDPTSRRNISQMLLRAGAGFAGGRTFGEGLSGALSGVADVADQQEQSAYELYKQQQLASLYGLRADTAGANIDARLGAAQTAADARTQSAQTRADAVRRGQDIAHGDRQDALSQRSRYQDAALAVRQALANARGQQNAALTGAPYTPVNAIADVPTPQAAPQAPLPPSTAPSGPDQQTGAAPGGGAPTQPPQAPPQESLPAPPTDPWMLPSMTPQGGIRGAQQFFQRNQSERDRYARDHASDLSNDQTLLSNLDQYQGAYDRLQNTRLSYPGAGASWRIPFASIMSGQMAGNPDAADLRKYHNTLTMQIAGAKGRVLVAGLKTAGASLPDQSVPYGAGRAILQSTAANTRLQQAVDKARATLLQRNPNATPAQIESALGEYVQSVGSPYTTGKDGSVTPREIPGYEQWRSGGTGQKDTGASAPMPTLSRTPALNIDPDLRKRILADPNSARNSPRLKELGLDVDAIIQQGK